MTKLIALTTAATLALGHAAYAQDAADMAPSPEHESITDRAVAAGIVSTNGVAIGTTELEQASEVAELPTTIGEDEALAEIRETFAAADIDGDQTLTPDEFIGALRPTAEAVETEIGEPLTAKDDSDDVGQIADADAATAATGDNDEETGGDVAGVAGSDQDLSPITPTDYLTAKFEAIAGIDKQLSLQELETATQEDFAEADSDGDDVLNETEAMTFATLRTGRALY